MRAAAAVLLLLASACAATARRADSERELRAYYEASVADAFAKEDAEALAGLFDPGITKPMTQARILAWGRDFFLKYDKVRFHVDALAFEKVKPRRAVVRLTFHVSTDYGKGDFGGTERDVLVKDSGRWLTASWEKLPEAKR